MEIPSEVAVMTLPNATLFPQALLPLYIFEPRYRRMLAESLVSHRMFAVAMQKPARVRETPSSVAGLGLIRVSVANSDGTSHLILQGLTRVELDEVVQYKPYRVHRIRPLVAKPDPGPACATMVDTVRTLVSQRMELGFPAGFPFPSKPSSNPDAKGATKSLSARQIVACLDKLTDPDQVADLVSYALLTGAVERQTILETVEIEARLKHLIHFLLADIQRQRNETPNHE